MLIRVEQGKGRSDRNAMLSPQLLELQQLWWRERKRRGVMFPHGWLFPGRSYTDPISSQQLHRAVQEAAEVAGIRSGITPAGVSDVAPVTQCPTAKSCVGLSFVAKTPDYASLGPRSSAAPGTPKVTRIPLSP